MKKYIIVILISVFSLLGFTSATSCFTDLQCGPGSTCIQGTCSNNNAGATCSSDSDCLGGLVCNIQVPMSQGTCGNQLPAGNNPPATGGTSGNSGSTCTGGGFVNGQCVVNNAGTLGINMDSKCLINGQCSLDIYDTLGIRQSLPKSTRSSPGIFIQDIILSATFFVGTLITGVLVISGLLFVFAGANGNLAAKAKKGITGSLIGLLFVTGSYAFVRLIQFLVTGGGG